MNTKNPAIPFFTDNDVSNAVGDFLMDSGHKCTRLRDVILENSPDPIVAATCRESGMVLITHNIKHFRAIVKNHEVTRKEADGLSRIELACKQMAAVERLKVTLSIVESEWAAIDQYDGGMRLFIGDNVIRIHR